VFRVFRVFRLFKLLRTSRRIRILLATLAIALPAVVNAGLLFLVFVFVYACIGVGAFGDAPFGTMALYPPSTFANFGTSLLIILRVITGEGWEAIMRDLQVCKKKSGICF
jgi:hypothetical protein